MGGQEERDRHSQPTQGRRSGEDPTAGTATMKRAILMSFVALALLLCFCNADDSDDSDRGRASRRSKDDSGDSGRESDYRRSKAFLSRRESAEVVKHQKKNYGRVYNIAPAPAPARTRSPLEPYREVCETNLACDELADQIGFKAAYRRFYGPIRFY